MPIKRIMKQNLVNLVNLRGNYFVKRYIKQRDYFVIKPLKNNFEQNLRNNNERKFTFGLLSFVLITFSSN